MNLTENKNKRKLEKEEANGRIVRENSNNYLFQTQVHLKRKLKRIVKKIKRNIVGRS